MTTIAGPRLADVEGIGSLTLGTFLAEVVDRYGNNEALVFDDPLTSATVRWSYVELERQARAIAASLIGHDVSVGDRVAVIMGNRPEAVASIFGIAMAGAVGVPLSTFASPHELEDMLRRAAVVVVLTQCELLGRRFPTEIESFAGDVDPLRTIAVVGDRSWNHFVDGGAAVASGTIDDRIRATGADDEALIIFSSGTTSTAKGIVHGHRSPTLQFWIQSQIFGRSEQTRMWTSLPMFWTAGLNTAMGSTLAAGGCWVMQETFDPGPALALMARERVTEPYTLPHHIGALEEHPDWAAADLSSFRQVFGKSALARHPTVNGDPTWNMPVGYGLTETCAFAVAHWWDAPRELRKQSMGKLLPGVELRVVDPDTGRELGPDQDGELALRGATLMQHYLGMTPAECFDADGFFHTGDAGYFDADGYVHFTGRRTEMIKTGGANVSPAELEVQLRACPPVKLARIVGVPDPRLDQLVVACITLKEGAHATADDIQAFLRERVASYKVPKRVLFFDDGEIPMTTSDTKVRDDDLIALVVQRLEPQGTTT